MSMRIMIQGTTSNAGKSLFVTALCRIFYEDGFSTAPFKSQNMALNSFITDEGLEMGRAQVVQAEACGIKPKVAMNPVLLKPTTDKKSQVIIEGKVYKSMNAAEYYDFKNQLKDVILRNFKKLSGEYDIVVLEGAGSPAEINLKENDIVNMGMAEMADAPVLIIADIDRGGVFASVVGTVMLLDDEEKKRVKGIVINKFRGDIELLKPGISKLEEMVKLPVLGVIPYLDITIEEEDSLAEKLYKKGTRKNIKVSVLKLPKISNFTDFDAFTLYDDVSLYYVTDVNQFDNTDLLIIPGTKNTIDDLVYLKENGFVEKILELNKDGIPIVGICGGFQMLGKIIIDQHNVESSVKEVDGIGIIDMNTYMEKEKVTVQSSGEICNAGGILKDMDGIKIEGYEIHMGRSNLDEKYNFIKDKKGKSGFLNENVLGTYLHGLFDNSEFTDKLLNNIRIKNGLSINNNKTSYKEFKISQYNKLVDAVRGSVDIKRIYKILKEYDR